MASANARPTLRSSASFTVTRQIAVASSCVAGSDLSVRTTRLTIESKSSGPYGQASQNVASTSAAFASMSRPVRATVNALRKPPSSFIATLRVDGGACPRTPLMRTRSRPTCSSSIVSKRAVTSGPRYSWPVIS